MYYCVYLEKVKLGQGKNPYPWLATGFIKGIETGVGINF
jgi:hypothetical protein